jgi:tetratricopeptide (TPR) repeat protein
MTMRHAFILLLTCTGLIACATRSDRGTLAELEQVEADTEEIYLGDSLQRAAQSYRSYLEETPESARTPEAMRRLADLQIEQEYGVLGGGQLVEMPTPDAAASPAPHDMAEAATQGSVAPAETEEEFEQRASQRQALLSGPTQFDIQVPGAESGATPSGPREAIETYRKILETYPNYERNDQVLYQMSRAYDEIGQPDEAMAVMDRLVAEHSYSKYVDEVQFRRGEYFFVRKKYREAETAYGAIIDTGASSSYYELALYKFGWALYKQEFYDDSLHNFIAMLDHRLSIGYDFDQAYDEDDEHRVADTFRVISLSFSNLGGPEVVDEYFAGRERRSYTHKIYGNLGEFYFGKLRYDDAASVYKSFAKQDPFHEVSPHFSMRIVDIYGEAGFPKLVVESKKAFATTYALDAEYWNHFDFEAAPEVVGFLKTNLSDLANHYHALYQDENLVEERPASFAEAQRWYRQILLSFPADKDSPQMNYQLADLFLENENFGDAAIEYEHTAYHYAPHEQASAAGYAAVFAYREDLKVATAARTLEVKTATIASSLRFAETFQEHEQAPVVLAAAADDLYELKDFHTAIESAQKLIDRYPTADTSLRRSAWAVIAHSSIDLSEYQNAEQAYTNVLELTPADDESRPAIVDGLAAAIYKQGEQAELLEDHRLAADHFLRIKVLAPTSDIRSVAEYDAAAALMKLQDWSMASGVLEEFRTEHPEHDLQDEATKQLAYIYREDGQVERSAAEHERIAAESTDPELNREALLTAAELYDEVNVTADAIRVYEQYVAANPRPLDIAMETRSRLAEIYKAELDYENYFATLGEIVAADRDAGEERTDRSRYLAAGASLVLAEQSYEQFAALRLVQPFEQSLAEKQRRMDAAMAAFENLVAYEVAAVTAAATFYIAEIYRDFGAALLDSERPAGLSAAEKVDYEMVIEEEAFPFEEQAIDVHEENFELLTAGIYNSWVRKSLEKLAVLMPGRYAKNEISSGFVGSIDTYAYQMPIAAQLRLDEQDDAEAPESGDTETPEPADTADALEATAQVSHAVVSDLR